MFCRFVPSVLLVCLGAVLLAAGCGGGERAAGGGRGANVLRKGNGAEPASLDPHVITGHPEFNIAWALFEGLLSADPATLDLRPGMAEEWSVSEDGRVYRFRLREEARWSNGDPLRAEDFLFGWRRMLTPELAAPYASFHFCVEGARDYYEGRLEDFAETGYRALSPTELEIRLLRPTPHFGYLLTQPFFFPLHRPSVEAAGDIARRGGDWMRAGRLVSNGPFQLTTWEPNRVVGVRRNPHYWDRRERQIDGVDFRPISSLQTEERAFRTGELDLTHSLAPNKIPVYREQNSELLHIDPYYGTYFYRFNCSHPALGDPRVRRALAMAIDRQAIIDYVALGGQRPARALTPPGLGYEPPAGIPHDPEAARALLAEAGYPGGEGLPTLSILYNTAESHRAIAEAIQNMWKTELGVDVELHNQDWKVYLSTVRELDYAIARGSWIGDYPDPATFLELFTSYSDHNRAAWQRPEYDRLIEAAADETRPERRMEILREAERLLLAETPVAPIYYYSNIYLQVPRLKGCAKNPLNYKNFKYMYFEDAE